MVEAVVVVLVAVWATTDTADRLTVVAVVVVIEVVVVAVDDDVDGGVYTPRSVDTYRLFDICKNEFINHIFIIHFK